MDIFRKYCVIFWPVVSNLWDENSFDSGIFMFGFSNTYLLYNRRYTDLSKSCYLILIRNKHVMRLHTSYNVDMYYRSIIYFNFYYSILIVASYSLKKMFAIRRDRVLVTASTRF